MSHIHLQTNSLSIGYHSRLAHKPLARDLNLTLNGGSLVCIIGPNGSGKSTLLRTLAGLQKPLAGSVTIDGVTLHEISVAERAKRISIVLTEHYPPGNLSVRQVVALGRLPYTDWLGTLTDEDNEIVTKVLQQLEAGHLADRQFNQLSDGERQKTMIARALAQQPAVMILDEPTAYLDWHNRLSVLMQLKELAQTTDKAFLLSSHDLEMVCQVTDELWVMDGKGQVICGAPQQLAEQGLLKKVFSTPYGSFNLNQQ